MKQQEQGNRYLDYLVVISETIKERALKAVASRKDTYDGGRIMGFNEFISIMQQTAKGMNISLKDIGLDDINPDKDLV